MTAEPWQLAITALGEALAARRLTPVDLVEAYTARIDALDGRLHAFVHLSASARAEAEAAGAEIAAGRIKGPLHGIPVAIKDNYATRGMPTTAGTAAPGLDGPEEDATAVARLREAGAIILG
ncbi:MAG: amidase family protein, partial [Pseudomonadota bacterium]